MRKHILFLFMFFSVTTLTAQSSTEIIITFQVDMELEIAAARFNPSTDTLFTRTSFDNWLDNVILSPSEADSNIYVGSGYFETFEDDLFYYKHGYTTANGTNWEGGDSRHYTMAAIDITNGFVNLGWEGFGMPGGIGGVNLHETEIRFIVDMNNAVDGFGLAFPSIDNVVIAGPSPQLVLPDWGWPDSDSNKVLFMFDDGTNGDEIAGDNFWTIKVTFPIYTPIRIQYKYGANWGLVSNGGTNNNESSNPWQNHFVDTFIGFWKGDAVDEFGIMGYKDIVNSIEQIGNEIPSTYELKQNYPNPFNPSTIINFSIPESGFVTLNVFNILGQEIAELVNEIKSAGSYEVSFDASTSSATASDLTTGMYIYKTQASVSTSSATYVDTKKMLLIK